MQVSINQQVGYSKPFFQANTKTSTMPDDKKPASIQGSHEANNSSQEQQESSGDRLRVFFKALGTGSRETVLTVIQLVLGLLSFIKDIFAAMQD